MSLTNICDKQQRLQTLRAMNGGSEEEREQASIVIASQRGCGSSDAESSNSGDKQTSSSTSGSSSARSHRSKVGARGESSSFLLTRAKKQSIATHKNGKFWCARTSTSTTTTTTATRICQMQIGAAQEAPKKAFKQPTSARLLLLLLAAATTSLAILTLPSAASGQTLLATSDDNSSASPISSSTQDPLAVVELANPSLAPPGGADANNSAHQNGQHKLKPVNFTLVDEIFESSLDDDEEVARRWRRMDSQLQDGMKAILKMIFPQIVSISQDAKVSGDCSGGILKWILSLRNLRSWAIKMLDATGKPTAGVFEGSLSMLGNYRQCLSIRAPDEDEIEITDQFEEYFRGQYCVLHLKPWMPVKRPFYHLNSSFEFLLRKNYKYYEKTLYDELADIAVAFNFVDIRMDLCVPSTCTVADIQRVAELLSRTLEMKAKVMRCDTAPRDTSLSALLLAKLDRSTCVWLSVPLALITLSLLSTLLFGFGSSSKSKQSSRDPQSYLCSADQQQQQATAAEQPTQGKLFTIFQSLSIGGARSEAPPGGDSVQVPKVLYGLRNLFVVWFIIVQMTVELKYQYLRESLQLRNMILSYWPFQLIINSSLLFEALVVISAFIYGYACRGTFRNLIGSIANKYVSLLVAQVALIGLTIVTPILAIESPVWRNFVEDQAETCKSTGYVNLFFLQNFIPNYDNICLPHTWLFCVELQLIVLMIPVMLDLRGQFEALEESLAASSERCLAGCYSNAAGCAKSKDNRRQNLLKTILIKLFKSNSGLLGACLILIGFCVNFVLVYANQLPPSWFYSFPDPAQKSYYFGKYLTKSWTHLSSFLVGLLAGHISRSHLRLRQLLAQQHSTNNSNNSANENDSIGAPNESPQLSQTSSSTSNIVAMEISCSFYPISSSTPSSLGEKCHKSTRKSTKRRFGSAQTLTIVLVLLMLMLVIIVSTFTWSTQPAASPSALVAGAYDAGSRLVWSLALSGIMFILCRRSRRCQDRGNLIERFLSHSASASLGKLAPLAYLVAPYVNTFVLAAQEQTLFPSMLIMFHVILGNIAIIYAMAFALAALIERPVRRLVNKI